MNIHRKNLQEVILVSKVKEDYHGVTASYTIPEIKGIASWAGIDGLKELPEEERPVVK